jgi:hypothetical protein
MMQDEQIRELSLKEIEHVTGGGTVTDTIVNVAKEIGHAVCPTGIMPPSIPEIGRAIASVGSFLGSIF